jgi:lipopolysaccharide/colanic/teichoic acid biosynthesis glycosyltransferase
VLKRGFDIIGSALGLLLLLPVLLACAVAVRLDSRGPVLFRQERIGRSGRPFTILKLRTMVDRPRDGGPLITAAGDPRVTAAGRWLRRTKLDELPQLINVLRGEMSLVGPRPEAGRYVALYPDAVRDLVLSVRPGITDEASILFRNESELLANAQDPDAYYASELLPRKLEIHARYARQRSFAGDLRILSRTLRALIN